VWGLPSTVGASTFSPKVRQGWARERRKGVDMAFGSLRSIGQDRAMCEGPVLTWCHT